MQVWRQQREKLSMQAKVKEMLFNGLITILETPGTKLCAVSNAREAHYSRHSDHLDVNLS